jgi:hypothetical protein
MFGTGLTKGPYTPTADVSFSVSDPNVWGNPSTFVQIQNASGFTLSVATSGAPYSIQPQTATTIPTLGDGSVITITPSSGIANQVGTITTVWLLDEQNPPIPDGYLTSATANQRIALSNTVNGLSTYTGNVATLGTDQSALIVLHPVAGSPTFSYSLKGNQSGILYASGSGTASSTASTILGPWPIYGNLDTTLALSITNNGLNQIDFDFLALNSITNAFTPVKGGSNLGLGVYQYGGALAASVALISTTAATALLAAPAAGTVYRLHTLAITNNTGSGGGVRFYTASAPIAELHMGSQNNLFLGGLLIDRAITIVSFTSVGGSGIVATARYDVITTPSIY